MATVLLGVLGIEPHVFEIAENVAHDANVGNFRKDFAIVIAHGWANGCWLGRGLANWLTELTSEGTGKHISKMIKNDGRNLLHLTINFTGKEKKSKIRGSYEILLRVVAKGVVRVCSRVLHFLRPDSLGRAPRTKAQSTCIVCSNRADLSSVSIALWASLNVSYSIRA